MKRFRPELLCLALFAGMAVPGYSQQNFIPPSPEVAAQIRNINIPVSHYTGTANISVPLYTIQTRDFQIPVQLDYQASGIKVQDCATWVGLGWRLSVPGSITRVVRSGYDEYGFGAGHGALVRDGEWNEALFDAKIDNCDSEADLFYFDIPGKSGLMVCSPEKKFYTVPYQNLKIDYNSSPTAPFYQFVLTDEQGNRYVFDMTEFTYLDTYTSMVTAWSLSQIVSPQGDWIKFDYISGLDLKYSYMAYNRCATYEVTLSPFSRILKEEDNVSFSQDISISPRYLRSIQWPSGKLEFISDDQRAALDIRTRRLTEIKLYAEPDRYVKSFKLTYNTFLNSALQLWKVEETNEEQGASELICHFNYNTEQNLPYRNSLDMDHWGYYNGPTTGNGKMFPAHTVRGHAIEGADRSPRWPYMTANMLTSITYKGGGKKEFEYEQNQLPSGKIVGGVRIKKIKEYASESSVPSVIRYEYLEGEVYDSVPYYTSVDTESPYLVNTFTYKINGMSFNTLFDMNGSSVVYPLVKEILPDGSYTLYRYTSFSQYPDSLPEIYTPYVAGMMHEPSSYTSRTYLPRSSFAWQRGLLLQQSVYSADGTLQTRQTNRYDMDAPAKASFLCATMEKSQYPIFGTPTKRFATYKWISKPIYLDSVIVEQGPFLLPSVTSYKYDTTYLHVKEEYVRDARNDLYKTTFKYPCDYDTTSRSGNMFLMLLGMLDAHMTDRSLEVLYYKNDQIVGGRMAVYKVKGNIFSGRLFRKQFDCALKLPRPIPDNEFVHSNHGEGLDMDSRYDTLMTVLAFDDALNPVCTTDKRGGESAYIYGYDQSLPIAVVRNAMTYETPEDYTPSIRQEIFYTSFEEDTASQVKILPLAKTGRKAYQGVYTLPYQGIYQTDFHLSYWISRDEGRTWNKVDQIRNLWGQVTLGEEGAYIDEVRVCPPDARMTTYTHLPGIGMTSQTDPNGNTTYYEYDALGRLSAIRDNERRLLRTYQYQ